MKRIYCIVLLAALPSITHAQADESILTLLPQSWIAAWSNPPNQDRPLKIIHELGDESKVSELLTRIRERGLGGIVTNVSFANYMRSEQSWRTLESAVKTCKEMGLVVWIYDEQGYPSAAAGGEVLKENPDYEALELAYDPSLPEPFIVRPSFEYVHASNNFYACRRYPNIIDQRAVDCFIEKTHAAYWNRLQPFFGKPIQALFTDEPSLMALNLGQIPEQARKNVPVVDSIDASKAMLPVVPWSHDLPQQYQKKYREDLMAQRASLFGGNSERDRRTRQQYWSLIAELVAKRYFASLQRWCGKHHVASSGHTLSEESLIRHVALEGNALKALMAMDIPGLDMLSSDPMSVLDRNWLTAALPSSAAQFNGDRRVMTEVSDFDQTLNGKPPASLPEMQATAAWQAAWGATDFTLYYDTDNRSLTDVKAYGDFVGRLNTIVKPARFDRTVLLYYPIVDLWQEYHPIASPINIESQSQQAQKIMASFLRLGRLLQSNQIPFVLVDHEILSGAKLKGSGRLKIADQEFGSLLLPEMVEPPLELKQQLETWQANGFTILRDGTGAAQLTFEVLKAQLKPSYQLDPSCEHIVAGTFIRESRPITLLVNVGTEPYDGRLIAEKSSQFTLLDPATGEYTQGLTIGDSGIVLSLGSYQTLLLVFGEP